MQRFVSKYGLAAHLAILAVAPLFLFLFCGELWIGRTILWLSLYALCWIGMEPSRRQDEMLHDARYRVFVSSLKDPLFWFSLLIAAVVGVRALNGGIGMAYDAESAEWTLKTAALPFLPGCVDGAGSLPFAVSLSMVVLFLGCRHALGKSARISFLLTSTTLAGLAAVVALTAAAVGSAPAKALMDGGSLDPSYLGVAFGVHFVASMVALVGTFELRWKKAMPLLFLSVGCTALGLFAFAPAYVTVVFAAAAVLALLPALVYVALKVGRTTAPKCLVFLLMALALTVLLVMWMMPKEALQARLAAFSGAGFFPEDFASLRTTLSGIAQTVWKENPWLGSGLGSFSLDIRFNAAEADWDVIPMGQLGALNGWWQLLAERGITGALTLLSPLLFLLWTFVFRLVCAVKAALDRTSPKSFLQAAHPACWLGVIALAAPAVCGFIDHSFWTPPVLMACGALFALAGSSFPIPKKREEEAENTEK